PESRREATPLAAAPLPAHAPAPPPPALARPIDPSHLAARPARSPPSAPADPPEAPCAPACSYTPAPRPAPRSMTARRVQTVTRQGTARPDNAGPRQGKSPRD